MKNYLASLFASGVLAFTSGQTFAATAETLSNEQLALRNIERAVALVDGVIDKCFHTGTMNMGDVYNFATGKPEGTADVWPYTAAIEAVNSVLEGLETLRESNPSLYESHHDRYVQLMSQLYDGIDYYSGSFKLTSFTRTGQQWTVYGVHRGPRPGQATVAGIENVYDDQMWIVRELIRAYRNTGQTTYLRKAEYLTQYVLDGWDCIPDAGGNEYGGISWGPGYNSKHSCSNGPIISPLVWLAEMYKGKDDAATSYYVDIDGTRGSRQMKKYDYYLGFAKKVYAWQKEKLLNKTTGVYWDMLGADNTIQYEEVDGMKYRKHVDTGGPVGTAFTYNTGTMLSGAVDLYNATGDASYYADVKALCSDSRSAFCKPKRIDLKQRWYFPYDNKTTEGFNAWFDDVLMRAYADAVPYDNAKNADFCLDVFQENLDYAYDKYLRDGFLPNNILDGWSYKDGDSTKENDKTKGFHQLAYASEYAVLAVTLIKNGDGAMGIVNFKKETPADVVDVYDVDGQNVRSNVSAESLLDDLPNGVYIVEGLKYTVRR